MAQAAFALLGPTASGKSGAALEAAQRVPAEIVSMDSAQVYRGLDIGTAKPAAEERAAVPHHLIDLVDPHETYSTGRWRDDCVQAVLGILARGKVPLIVGGTMLYYRALASGLDALPPADASVRAAIDAEAAREGWPALHARLAAVDAPSAARIGPNDPQRIQRALEVWRLTGRPLSSLQSGRKAELPFVLRAFALVPERKMLHARIEARFEAMLERGLVDEVRRLKARYPLTAQSPSMRCVGYRQVWEHLEGNGDRAALRERGVAATRQLAKRQMTWLRSFGDVVAVEPGEFAGRLAHSFL